MYKQSPSRNHRSKGIKVKHILQISVLVAVCFWLLYQVKHSHEKRKEFELNEENSVLELQSDSELQRFGRKDIPRVTDIATNIEKHEEDEDDKDKEGEEDKENKHEEDEMESEDARVAGREEQRGGGDDEIDEHESGKSEEEEEDKERESVTEESHNENEEREDVHEEGRPEEEEDEESGKEDHIESEESDDVNKDHGQRETTLDDHDEKRNTREAQEELYRGDDASSEVAQNVQSVSQENKNGTMGQANEIYRNINFGQEHETKTSENADGLMKPDIQPREDVNSTASNATITEHRNEKVNLTKADDSSLQNSTLPEILKNSIVFERLAVSLLSNGSQATLDSNLSQNGTVGIKQATAENDQNKAGEDANNIENGNTNKTLSLFDATNDNEPAKLEDIGKTGVNENSKSHSSEERETIQHDPIDATDTAIFTHEDESSTDLDTLPEIRSEVHDTEMQ